MNITTQFALDKDSVIDLNNIMKWVIIVKLLLLFTVLTTQAISAQTASDDNYKVYKTSQYDSYFEDFDSQEYDVKRQLMDYNTNAQWKHGYNFDIDFMKDVIAPDKFASIRENRSAKKRLSIRYIIDETGDKVFAAALYLPKRLIELSEVEAQAILEKAMTHRFEYINKPNNLGKFYFVPNYFIVI